MVEAYEAVDPDDEQSPLVPGGPCKWQVTFAEVDSTDNLEVSPLLATDFAPGVEGCEIYQLRSEQQVNGKIKVRVRSDYMNGHFVCDSVRVERIHEE